MDGTTVKNVEKVFLAFRQAILRMANDLVKALESFEPLLNALEPPPPSYYEDRRRMQHETAIRARRSVPLTTRMPDRPEVRRKMMPCQRY